MTKLLAVCILSFALTHALFAGGIKSAKSAELSLTDTGTGLDRTVTVESKGQFRLVFEAADNWGIAQWYDLVNDPGAKTNLAFSKFADPGVSEAGLFQMVWYGTKPDDPKLFMHAAKFYHPKSERAFSILDNTPSRVVVESVSHPLLAAGVARQITVSVRYHIYPDGKIYLTSRMSVTHEQNIKEWRCAVIGLCDPTQAGSTVTPDSRGWLRSSSSQNPYGWSGKPERYLFAYWAKTTPEPYSNWTKASIMLVPAPDTPLIASQNGHNWTWFKRWYYRSNPFVLKPGETVVQNYLLQLGAENSAVLPDIADSSAANPIAAAYLSNPTPPGGPIREADRRE